MKSTILLSFISFFTILSIPASAQVDLFTDSQKAVFKVKGQEVLHYQMATTPAPEGANPLYAKSGYIHPLFAPDGTRLTRIQPPDHFHHYGVWGPWTHTQINGERVDFWNLKEGQGTVMYSDIQSIKKSENAMAVTFVQHHITLPDSTLALEEYLTITVHDKGNNTFVIDYTSQFNSPLEEGMLFEQYRYGGGIGFRATEKWGTENSTVLTSEGFDRTKADASGAKWCRIIGDGTESEKVGVLFLSHKENRAHPEPMRMWPPDTMEGKENVFFEFTPIRHEEWKIEPNTTYTLKYRIISFNSNLSPEQCETEWKTFNK